MAKGGELGPDTVRAARGALSRTEFARRVGVTPLTVYRWELPDGAAESRRPRGAVADRLRRVIASETTSRDVEAAPASANQPNAAPLELHPSDASSVWPAIERILRAEFAPAEDDLMQLLVSSSLQSPAGRALAQASLSLGRVLRRNDARAGFTSLQPALAEADAGRLPPVVEVVVRTAASLVFSVPDAHFLDVGRVNAQVAAAARVITPDTSPDLVFLLRLGAAYAAMLRGVAGHESRLSAESLLADWIDAASEPVPRLLADELRTVFAMFSGQPGRPLTTRFEELISRAAKLGVPVVEVRALAFLARRFTEEAGEPARALELTDRARAVETRARLSRGLHSVLVPVSAAAAYLRLGRFAEAERALDEGMAIAQTMSWPPIPLVMPYVRLFQYTGRPDRVTGIAEKLIRMGGAVPLALGKLLVAALETASGGGRMDELARAERRLEQSRPNPLMLREALFHSLNARLPCGEPADIRLASRRVEGLLDRRPSVFLSAGLRRCAALSRIERGTTPWPRR